jgi:hypothetical protein
LRLTAAGAAPEFSAKSESPDSLLGFRTFKTIPKVSNFNYGIPQKRKSINPNYAIKKSVNDKELVINTSLKKSIKTIFISASLSRSFHRRS